MNLLFDIGATTMRVGVSDGDTLLHFQKNHTPQGYEEGLRTLVDVLGALSSGKNVESIVGGFAAPIDKARDQIGNPPNLPDWGKKSLRLDLENYFKVPVYVENDAALAGLGEAVYGAGKEFEIVAYITISTGIGGVRIVGKKIDVSHAGFEPGHMYIDFDTSASDAEKGTLGYYASGAALPVSLGKRAEELTEDEKHTLTKWLAYGLHNVLVMWSPDVLVLGGGLINSHCVLIEQLQDQVQKVMYIYDQVSPFVQAQLGDENGLYGAIAFTQIVR